MTWKSNAGMGDAGVSARHAPLAVSSGQPWLHVGVVAETPCRGSRAGRAEPPRRTGPRPAGPPCLALRTQDGWLPTASGFESSSPRGSTSPSRSPSVETTPDLFFLQLHVFNITHQCPVPTPRTPTSISLPLLPNQLPNQLGAILMILF